MFIDNEVELDLSVHLVPSLASSVGFADANPRIVTMPGQQRFNLMSSSGASNLVVAISDAHLDPGVSNTLLPGSDDGHPMQTS